MNATDYATRFTAPNSVAVDCSALARISRGKPDIERALVALFRRRNNEDIDALERAVSESDVTGAVVASQRISVAGRMIGAMGLTEACDRLEASAHANDFAALRTKMDALHVEVERVYVHLGAV